MHSSGKNVSLMVPMLMNDKDAQHSQTGPEDSGEQAIVLGDGMPVAEHALQTETAAADALAMMSLDMQPGAETEMQADIQANTQVDIQADIPIVPVYELPGKLLAARREELRWSLDEAALRLKLTPRQVSALEADDYAQLPGMASVRGFVRSYAKLVGLDPQLMLDSLANQQNPAYSPMVLRRPLPSNGFPGRRSSPPPRRNKWLSRVTVGLVVVAAIAGGVYELIQSQWLQLPEEMAMDISLPELPTLGFVSNEPVAAVQAAAQAIAAEVVPADKKVPATAPTPPKPALDLKLQEDAWVEITTLNGEKLVSRLLKAGTTESFEVGEPIVLVVGNAAAVEARFRGQPLNLKAVAHDNVSKLNLK